MARSLLLGLLLGVFATCSLAQGDAPTKERWMLMARHGECAPLSSLTRRVPEMGHAADPQAFASLMRQQGFAVTAVQRSLPKGQYWEVSVPAKELALVFVTSELCQLSR